MRERWSGTPLYVGERGAWDGARSWPTFEDWCRDHRGRAARLWLSCAWTHELTCDDGLPLADDAAVIGWARTLLQHYHGETAALWTLAAWQHGRRRGASALHGTTLDGLRAAAAASRVTLRSVRPWWSGVVRRAVPLDARLRAATARLVVVEGPRLAAVSLRGGRLDGVEVRRLDGANASALRAWLRSRPEQPTLAVGHGIGGDDAALEAIGTLHGEWPSPRWLGRAS